MSTKTQLQAATKAVTDATIALQDAEAKAQISAARVETIKAEIAQGIGDHTAADLSAAANAVEFDQLSVQPLRAALTQAKATEKRAATAHAAHLASDKLAGLEAPDADDLAERIAGQVRQHLEAVAKYNGAIAEAVAVANKGDVLNLDKRTGDPMSALAVNGHALSHNGTKYEPISRLHLDRRITDAVADALK